MRVGARYVSKVTTITYVVTAVIDDACELKLDKDCLSGLMVTRDELAAKYLLVVDPYET